MSFNSPAKQKRIETHLMRQRGAGVRTVSSNFGFAFGSISAPISNDATPARDIEEPPAKRRKTLLSNELAVVEPIAASSGDVIKSKKAAKSRRRLDLDEEDTKAPQSPSVGDDSFIAGLGTKKAAAKKTKTKTPRVARNKEAAEVVEYEPPTTSRPKRRAAATAASKVTEGFEEEVVPVDKKRRIEKQITKTSTRRKEVVAQAEQATGTIDHAAIDIAVKAMQKAAPRERTTGRKRKDGHQDAVDDERDELAASVAVRRGDNSRVGKEDGPTTAPPSTAVPKSKNKKSSVTAKRKRQSSIDEEKQTQATSSAQSGTVSDSPMLDAKPAIPSRIAQVPRRKRQPLAETDMNITIRSSSPEKTSKERSAIKRKAESERQLPQDSIISQQASKPSKKRLKRDSKRDGANNVNNSSTKEPPAIERKAENDRQLPRPPSNISQPLPSPPKKRPRRNTKRERANADTSPAKLKQILPSTTALPETQAPKQAPIDQPSKPAVDPVRSANQDPRAETCIKRRSNLNRERVEVTAAKTASSRETSAPASVEENARLLLSARSRGGADRWDLPDIGVSISARPNEGENVASRVDWPRDEDVDWLFAPLPQAGFPKSMAVKAKGGVKSRKVKMPEMDLDDLLSDIAAFAQEKAEPTPVVLQNAAGETKIKGGARKKAKV